jgi:hypothetical protein
MRKFKFGTAAQVAEALEAALDKLHITIAPGSALERLALSAMTLVERASGRARIEKGSDIRQEYADTAALAEIGTQIVLASAYDSFKELGPHLELLNKAEAGQNKKASILDRHADKVFELLTACYAIQWGHPIHVDHPIRSLGDNPDVIVDLPEGRLAIACKAVHSKAPQTIIDRIIDGVDQIERADCATGFVFISLKNVLDYDVYWPGERGADGDWTWSAWNSHDDAIEALKSELLELRDTLVNHAGGEEPLKAIFSGRKAVPLVAFYTHVMCGIVVDGLPASASLRLPYFVIVGEITKTMHRRISELNDIIQLVPSD